MFNRADLDKARAIVGAAMAPTPAIAWPLLKQRCGADVFVKHENHTPTGAFKVRGGLVYAARCRAERPTVRGLISATRGNHGQSLAFAGRRHDLAVTILVPRANSVEKNAAMRAFGANLIEFGEDFEAARREAERRAASEDLELVPSFHPDLVLGVATYALELFAAVGDLDTLYVPVGMGSGICACILVRDLLGLKTEVVGVQAEGAPAYARSFAAGHAVSTEQALTLADGLATRVPVAEAVSIIAKGAARIVELSDAAIAEAVRAYWTDTHNLAEGAGAAPLAALLKERARMAGRRVGVILCGGNIDLDLFRRWILFGADPAA